MVKEVWFNKKAYFNPRYLVKSALNTVNQKRIPPMKYHIFTETITSMTCVTNKSNNDSNCNSAYSRVKVVMRMRIIQ